MDPGGANFYHFALKKNPQKMDQNQGCCYFFFKLQALYNIH